jgi:hypothetical protein
MSQLSQSCLSTSRAIWSYIRRPRGKTRDKQCWPVGHSFFTSNVERLKAPPLLFRNTFQLQNHNILCCNIHSPLSIGLQYTKPPLTCNVQFSGFYLGTDCDHFAYNIRYYNMLCILLRSADCCGAVKQASIGRTRHNSSDPI